MDWQGAACREQVAGAVQAGLTEFGLRHEGEAKSELKKGRGVVTGTLRRSVHSAEPTYNFAADDVQPNPGSPERGGSGGQAAIEGDVVSILVGSGLVYARVIEDRYAYMSQSHARVLPDLVGILEKHAAARGLK